MNNWKTYAIGSFPLMLAGPYLLLKTGLILAILGLAINLNRIRIQFSLQSLISILLIFSLALGAIFSSNEVRGWSIVGRNIPILLFAILGLFASEKSSLRHLNIQSLVIGTTLFSIVCLTFAGWHSIELGSMYDPPHENHFLYNNFIHQNLTHWIGLNAVYLAAASAICLVPLGISLIQSLETNRSNQRNLSIILIGFQIAILVLTKSVMIVSSLLLVIGLLFWKQKEFQSIRRNFPRIFVALIIASIGLATWVAITKFQTIQIHFDPSDPYLRPFSIRLAIWQNALSEILADPWLGYGTGDSLGAMLSAYESSHFAIGTQNGFNAHNQFFELWLQIGILGPVLFLLMLVHGFILAWKANGWIRCSALIVFFMLSLSESTLMTFRGVCFLCFILFITFDPENNEGITGP